MPSRSHRRAKFASTASGASTRALRRKRSIMRQPPMVRIERHATPSNHAISSQGKSRDRCSRTGWVAALAGFCCADGARSTEILDPSEELVTADKGAGRKQPQGCRAPPHTRTWTVRTKASGAWLPMPADSGSDCAPLRAQYQQANRRGRWPPPASRNVPVSSPEIANDDSSFLLPAVN